MKRRLTGTRLRCREHANRNADSRDNDLVKSHRWPILVPLVDSGLYSCPFCGQADCLLDCTEDWDEDVSVKEYNEFQLWLINSRRHNVTFWDWYLNYRGVAEYYDPEDCFDLEDYAHDPYGDSLRGDNSDYGREVRCRFSDEY